MEAGRRRGLYPTRNRVVLLFFLSIPYFTSPNYSFRAYAHIYYVHVNTKI
jgi:hypothetical protein